MSIVSVFSDSLCTQSKAPLLLSPLLAEEDRQLGCGVCGGWWRATVCFFLPAVWIHRLQRSLRHGGLCLRGYTPEQARIHTPVSHVTWPFGLCSTTTSHISFAGLALNPPPLSLSASWLLSSPSSYSSGIQCPVHRYRSEGPLRPETASI